MAHQPGNCAQIVTVNPTRYEIMTIDDTNIMKVVFYVYLNMTIVKSAEGNASLAAYVRKQMNIKLYLMIKRLKLIKYTILFA